MNNQSPLGWLIAAGIVACGAVTSCNDSEDEISRDAGPEETNGGMDSGKLKDGGGIDSSVAATDAALDADGSPATPTAWLVPFLRRTPSPAVRLTNCSNVTITGKQFVDVAGNAIVIENCDNVTITENDFSNNVGAVYVLNSTNVKVTWNRYQNIGNGTIGGGRSNFVQFNKSVGGTIARNKGIGGNTEDIVSVYQSGGPDAAHPLLIEYNAFEGTTWTSSSGSGLMLGDSGGAHIVARFNTFLTPGQVGIGVPGGTDIHVTDNVFYGAARASANVGVYVWNQSAGACASIEVARNQAKWFRADGVENPYWNAGNCGAVAGESTNLWSAPVDPKALHVVL